MQRTLKAAQARLRAFAQRAQVMAKVSSDLSLGGDALIQGGLAFGAPIVAGLKQVIGWASKAEEGMNRFNVVMGDQAASAGAWADQTAQQVGRSALELKDNLATFQGFNVGLGFDPAMAKEMSQALVGLGLDLASFNNLSDEDAMQRMLAAMSGSSEVLAKFGINTKDAALQQEALNRGFDAAKLTEQQKAMLRLSIIGKSLGQQGAMGDAARTADSFANTQKRLLAGTVDLAVGIGSKLLPAVTALFHAASGWVQAAVQWVSQNAGLVQSIGMIAIAAVGVAAGIVGLGLAVKIAAGAIYGLHLFLMPLAIGLKIGAAAAGLFASALGAVASPVGLALAAVAALGAVALWASGALQPLMKAWGDLSRIVGETIGVIRDRLMAGDLAGAARVAWEGIKAAWTVGVARLKEAWTTFSQWFLQLSLEGFDMVAGWALDAVASIRTGWADLQSWFAKFWADTSNRGSETWNMIILQAKRAGIAVREALDQDYDANQARNAAEKKFTDDQIAGQKKLRTATAEADDANAKARADAERQQAGLDGWITETLAGSAQAVADAQAAADATVATATDELKAAIARIKTDSQSQAAPDAAAAPAADTSGLSTDFESLMKRMRDTLAGGTDTASKAASAVPDGGFDARTLNLAFGAGGERDARQTAQNTAETVRLMRRLVDGGGRLVFG
jgi:hypothetical protein